MFYYWNVKTDFGYVGHANSESESNFSLPAILFVQALAVAYRHLTDLKYQLSVSERLNNNGYFEKWMCKCQQNGYTKHPCFMCFTDNRNKKYNLKRRDWPMVRTWL